MNRFYAAATHVLSRSAIIDKLVGDEVMALYLPALLRDGWEDEMLRDARDLLTAVGFEDGEEPWLPLGVGLDLGSAYVGNVGSGEVKDFTALGDVVNTAARLQSSADAGQIVVSERLFGRLRDAEIGATAKQPLAEGQGGGRAGACDRARPGAGPAVNARLYWFPLSHPSQAVVRMLELKGVDADSANVLPGTQRIHMRLVGFRGGTVPALKLNGQRVQGSRQIALALERLVPEPSLFPRDPTARARADEAERWGDEELQNVPRTILRWGLIGDGQLRRWLAEQSKMPAPAVAARTSGPVARYYAWAIGADEDGRPACGSDPAADARPRRRAARRRHADPGSAQRRSAPGPLHGQGARRLLRPARTRERARGRRAGARAVP